MTAAHAVHLPDIEHTAIAEFIALGSTESSRRSRGRTSVAFTRQFTDLRGWSESGSAAQLDAAIDVRGFVGRILTATGHPAGAFYAVASQTCWGAHAALVHAEF